MTQAQAAQALNLSVLKRHDSSITEIVDSASYVVLYRYSDEWTKTGIEGTMFLFKRTRAPFYGFFILNRHGLENFCENLADESELEITPEFIIFSSQSDHKVYGMWVFEADQRERIGQRMLELSRASQPPIALAKAKPVMPTPTGQNISLDMLFSSAAPVMPPQSISTQTQSPQPNAASLLDSIFSSAQKDQPTRSKQTAGTSGSTILNGISTIAKPANGEDALKAMLGLPTTRPIEAPPVTILQRRPAASKVPPPPVHDEARPTMTTANTFTPLGIPSGLDKRSFVRDLLTRIHTDDQFVDALYNQYASEGKS